MQNIAGHGTNGSKIFLGLQNGKWKTEKKTKEDGKKKEERGEERKRREKEGKM